MRAAGAKVIDEGAIVSLTAPVAAYNEIFVLTMMLMRNIRGIASDEL